MIINKLKLKNFRSHVNTILEFNQGISLIIGENGAGKSSIMEAISFALFKKFSVNINELIRRGEKELELELTFTVNNKTYIVNRIRTKGRSKAKLEEIHNGECINLASGDKEVNTYIVSLLSMDSELFLNAVYIKQGEISNLIDKKPADRKKLIGKLLGIDSLEKIYNDIPIYIRHYEREQERVLLKLDLNNNLLEDIEIKENEIKNFNEEYSNINLKLSKSIKELDNLSKEIDNLNLMKENHNILSNDLLYNNDLFKANEEKINSLTEQLKESDKNEVLSNEIKDVLKYLPLFEEIKDLIVIKDRLIHDKTTILKDFNEVNKNNKILNENKDLFKEYNMLENELSIINNIINEINPLISDLKHLKNNKFSQEEDLNNDLEEINEFINQINNKFNEKFENVEKIDEFFSYSLDLLKNEIKTVTENIQDLEKENSILNQKIINNKKPFKELDSIKNKCPVCKSEITKEKKEELQSSYSDIIENSKNLIKSNKTKLTYLIEKNNELNSNKSEIESINILKYLDKLCNLESKKTNIKNLNLEISEVKNKINDSVIKLIEINLTNYLSLKLSKDKDIPKLSKDNILNYIDLDEINNIHDYKLKLFRESKEFHDKYKEAEFLIKKYSDLNSLEKDITKIQLEIDDVDEKIKKVSLELLNYTNEDLNKSFIDNKINELRLLKDKYNQIIGSLSSKDNLIKDLEDSKLKCVNLKNKINDINFKINELNFDKKVLEKLKLDKEIIDNNILNLNSTKGELNGSINSLNKTLLDLNEKLDEYKNLDKENEKLKSFIDLLNDIRYEFSKDGIQRDLRKISKPIIQKSTLEIFEKFNFQYSDIILDEDYNITLFSPKGEVSIDMISGGEKIGAALSLRLGITQAISKGNLEMIMLDEPTTHLDINRRKDLIDILKNISITPQMIIVTHDSELEGVADKLIKIEKIDGVSKVIEDI